MTLLTEYRDGLLCIFATMAVIGAICIASGAHSDATKAAVIDGMSFISAATVFALSPLGAYRIINHLMSNA